MKVELTTGWSPEKFAPYGPAITAAMHRLVERFPRDTTIDHLAQEIIGGRRQLWLIMTDEDEFISFVVTQIQTNDATGLNMFTILSLAGDEGQSTVPLIGKLEAWAKEQGCDESRVWGRYGWKKPLAQEGYELDVAVFRKPL
jgi:hypothetical protein